MNKVEWLQAQPTKELIELIKEQVRELELQLANGVSLQESSDKTALLTARYVGVVNGLNWAWEQIKTMPEEKKEEEDTVEAYSEEYPDEDKS